MAGRITSPMKVLRWVPLCAVLLYGSNSVALAGPAERFVCERQSGGPMSSFALVVDYGAKSVNVPSTTGLETDADTIVVTDTSVKWSVMRGGVVFDRHTHELDWDMSDDYYYLEATGQFTDGPVESYRGKMRCVLDQSNGKTTPPHA